MKTNCIKSFQLPSGTIYVEIDSDLSVRFTTSSDYQQALYDNSTDWMNAADLRMLAKKLKKLAKKLDKAQGIGG